MNTDLGKEITAKRKEKGLTQSDIAARFGISVQAVSKWERGLSRPSDDIMDNLIDWLGLPVEKPERKKIPPLSKITAAFSFDFFKIIFVGVLLGVVICLIGDFLPKETCIIAFFSAVTAFCFITIIEREK